MNPIDRNKNVLKTRIKKFIVKFSFTFILLICILVVKTNHFAPLLLTDLCLFIFVTILLYFFAYIVFLLILLFHPGDIDNTHRIDLTHSSNKFIQFGGILILGGLGLAFMIDSIYLFLTQELTQQSTENILLDAIIFVLGLGPIIRARRLK